MKQIICCFLIFTYLFLFCSCEPKNEPIEVPVTFYYRASETEFGAQDDLIIAQVREAQGHSQDYHYLISLYLNGSITYDCISPFPGGTTLEEFYVDDSKAYIVLSSQITTLSGSELMLACACMTKTVLEMTGVEAVEFSTSAGTLNGKDSITLTADSFVYQETE